VLEIEGEPNGAPRSFLSFDDVSALDKYLKEELGLVFVGYHGTAPGNVDRILQNGIINTGTRESGDVWNGLYVADDAETAQGYLVNQNDPAAIRKGAVGSQIFRVYAPADTVFLDIKNISLEDLAKLPDAEINAIIRTQAEAQGINIDSDNVVIRGLEANGAPGTETIIKWNFAENTVFIPSSIQFDKESELTTRGEAALEREKSLGTTPEYQGFGSLLIGNPDVVLPDTNGNTAGATTVTVKIKGVQVPYQFSEANIIGQGADGYVYRATIDPNFNNTQNLL
jgi:Exotoxin A catalytic